jgi:hypothetical protein
MATVIESTIAILTAFSLAFVFVLPGLLIVMLFTFSSRRHGSLDWLESIFLALTISIITAGTVGLLLAELGYFSLLNLSVLLLGFSLLLWLIGKVFHVGLRWQPIVAPRGDWVAVILLLFLSGWLFMRPHEFVTGGADAGVYVSLGANIANTGSLLIREPLLADLDPDLWPGVLRQLAAWEQVDFIRFPGFYRSDTEIDLLIPQFFSLHPTWLAIAYVIGGVWGALSMTPLWAILGIWAIYLFARSLLARTLYASSFAWLPALLLTLAPLQIYFARYPTAEPLSQYLVWAGLWMFTQYVIRRDPNSLWGLAAGLTLGQVFLVRIDMLPLLLLPAIWSFFLLVNWKWCPSEWWFWGSFSASVAYASIHALLFSRPYTLNTYGAVLAILQRQFVVLSLFLLLLILIFGYAFLYRRERLLGLLRAAASSRKVRHFLSLLLVLLVLYAYFIRPALGDIGHWGYWYAQTIVPISNHENLVRLGWYLSPLAIWLSVLGGVLILEREAWRFMWPLLSVGGVFTIFYLYNIFNNPIQIYAMRRYVPVTVPLIMITIGYAFVWLWRHPLRQPVGRFIGAALIIALMSLLLYNNRLIWQQVDYAGGVDQLAQLATLLDEETSGRPIALFVDDAPVGAGAVFGTPLQYLYQMTAFDLQENQLAMAAMTAQIADWRRTGRSVYVVRKQGTTPLFDSSLLEPVDTFTWDTPLLEQTYDHPPATVQRSQYVLEIYRVIDSEPERLE